MTQVSHCQSCPSPTSFSTFSTIQVSQHLPSFLNRMELTRPDAASFAPALEALPSPIHSALHDLIGGLQEDVAVAPGEPIFFLLHCFLDFIWAIWQSFDYNSRSYDLAPSQAWAAERQQLGSESYCRAILVTSANSLNRNSSSGCQPWDRSTDDTSFPSACPSARYHDHL